MGKSDELQRQIVDGLVQKIEEQIRERLGAAAEHVDTDIIRTAFGEWQVTVVIEIRETETAASLKDKLFGLTSKVREAMGSEMRDVFPVILPVTARAQRAHA